MSTELPSLSPDPGPELGGEPVLPSGLVPLSATTWEGFTPKQKWDVIVSLRGPDMPNSETVKWFTTSVIRGKMRKVMRVGGTVNTDLDLIILPNGLLKGNEPEYPREKVEKEVYPGGPIIKRKVLIPPEPATTKYALYRDELLTYYSNLPSFAEQHFFQHVQEAADILSIPYVWVEGKEYAKVIGHYHRKATKLFIDLAPNGSLAQVELKRHLLTLERGGY